VGVNGQSANVQWRRIVRVGGAPRRPVSVGDREAQTG
jgi:hypothetical protein